MDSLSRSVSAFLLLALTDRSTWLSEWRLCLHERVAQSKEDREIEAIINVMLPWSTEARP